MADKKVRLINEAGDNLFPKTLAEIVENAAGQTLENVEAGAQVNKIEKITVNGVELSIVNKTAAITTVDAYSKTESDGKYATKEEVTAIPKFRISVVEELPLTGENAVVYLVKTGDTSKNLYTEYIWTGSDYEELGTQKIDISGKQDQLTEAQLKAVNSGITAEKVTKYDGYEATIAEKADADDVYTKQEADNKFLVEADIEDLAIADQVYTKTAADAKFAEKATTLAGYGITDAYTKTEIKALNYISYVELA